MSSTQPTRLIVISDPMAPDGDRMRHSYWSAVLDRPGIEEYGLADLDAKSTVLDLKGAKLLIVSWDSANGDAAYGSDRTLQYFQTQGRVRAEEVLADGGTVMSECQTVDGVPLQAAYDAIFGSGELEVLTDILPEPERRGEAALVASHFADHPLLIGVPPRVAQRYQPYGERMFYANYQGPEAKTRPLGEHYKTTTLWWGWFTWWAKGWVPLLYAELPGSYVRRHGRSAGLAPVLLARLRGNGMLIASTMWIAGAQCQWLIDNALTVSVDSMRRYNRKLRFRRGFADALLGVLIFLLLSGVLRLLVLLTLDTRFMFASWLLPVAGVGFIPLVTSAFNWYRHTVLTRPYGVSLLRAMAASSKRTV